MPAQAGPKTPSARATAAPPRGSPRPAPHGSPRATDPRAPARHPDERAHAPYSGMFPCLRFGSVTRLVRSTRSAPATFDRVIEGSITSSM